MAAESSSPGGRTLSYTKTFAVLVGNFHNEQRFTVYETALCQCSKFFKSSRGQQWCKDPSKPVDLSDEDPKIFASYLGCVYTQHVDTSGFEADQDRAVKYDYDAMHLIKLYILADKLQDFTSANLVMDEIIKNLDETCEIFLAEDIQYAYAHTLPGSKLRTVKVDIYTYETSWNLDVALYAPSGEFLVDLLNEVRRVKREQPNAKVSSALAREAIYMPKCRYHQYDGGQKPCEDTPESTVQST